MRCERCGAFYPTRDDVTDFLADLHAVPRLERSAVASEDARLWVDPAASDGTAHEAAGYRAAVAEARERLEWLLDRFPLPARPTVVELGADFGWGSAWLAERGARVVATEISDHIRHAADGGNPRVCRLQADMNRLPIADRSADVVWANACVHHSWDLAHTFREIARVLRPGGRAYLANEPLPAWPRYWLGFGFGRRERELGIHETWIGRRRWLALCRAAGLRPRLVVPPLAGAALDRRLRRRHLPVALGRLLSPLHRWLQVAVHLLAEKPEESRASGVRE